MTVPSLDSSAFRPVLEGRPEILFAYLFGSAGSGVTHGRSDVDVAVFLSEDCSDGSGLQAPANQLWIALHADLQQALGREDIDLVLLHRAPPLLAERVIRSGRLLFSRDEARRIRWIVETKSRYCDLRHVRSLLDRVVSDRIRRGKFGHAHG